MFKRSHRSKPALLIAFGASFAVCLVPLFAVVASRPLGLHPYLWILPDAPHPVVRWLAIDWGIAMASHLFAGTLLYGALARPSWVRILVVAACLLAFVAATNW